MRSGSLKKQGIAYHEYRAGSRPGQFGEGGHNGLLRIGFRDHQLHRQRNRSRFRTLALDFGSGIPRIYEYTDPLSGRYQLPCESKLLCRKICVSMPSPRRSKAHAYSISSSAAASNADGMVRPSALAVLRLTKSSNLVGCSIGRSDGSTPLTMRST